MKPLIVLTNDDVICPPGPVAARADHDPSGEPPIVATDVRRSAKGRSRFRQYDNNGGIANTGVGYKGQRWVGYSVKTAASPAVVHGIRNLAGSEISLTVSGANYVENVVSCVTVSGTIGTVPKSAEKVIPILAVSQEINSPVYQSYSRGFDFCATIHFTGQVAEVMLAQQMPTDTDALKLEITLATTTGIKTIAATQDKLVFCQHDLVSRDELLDTLSESTHIHYKGQFTGEDKDTFTLVGELISTTHLSLDLTLIEFLANIA